jgi:hypothetical protein
MTRLPVIAVVGLQCMACAHAQTNYASRTNQLAPPVHLRVNSNFAPSTNQPRSVTTIPGKVWRVRGNKMVLEDSDAATNVDHKLLSVHWPTNAIGAGVRTNSASLTQK